MDGSAGKLRDFLNETQYTAREADERIRATQLTGSGVLKPRQPPRSPWKARPNCCTTSSRSASTPRPAWTT